MTDSTIDQAIFSTLSYAAVFHSGVAKEELHRLLICSAPISKELLFQRLNLLIKRGVVVEQSGFVSLRQFSRHLSGSVSRWDESERKARELMTKASWLHFIPTILGVGITGSVAAHSAQKNDDIDVMIVCAEGTLWLTRAVVQAIAFFQGTLRRRLMKHVANRWCFNLWLDESSLSIQQPTLYLAREVVQVWWIMNNSSIHERFVSMNRWVREWYANTRVPHTEAREENSWWWTAPLEWVFYRLQVAYMAGKRSREVITPHAAFFHPRDTNAFVMRKYVRICLLTPPTFSLSTTTRSPLHKKSSKKQLQPKRAARRL